MQASAELRERARAAAEARLGGGALSAAALASSATAATEPSAKRQRTGPTMAERLEAAGVMDDAVSDQFKCAISLQIMDEPTLAADGHTYEYEAIHDWIVVRQKKTSPKTSAPLKHTQLTDNFSVRTMIREFVEEQEKLGEAGSELGAVEIGDLLAAVRDMLAARHNATHP